MYLAAEEVSYIYQVFLSEQSEQLSTVQYPKNKLSITSLVDSICHSAHSGSSVSLLLMPS